MIRKIVLIAIGAAFFSTTVQAGICISGRNLKTSKATERDYAYGQSLFSDRTYKNQSPKLSSYVGNATWNKVILQCNRTRDTNGIYVLAATGSKKNNKGKKLLRKQTLKTKVIRGKKKKYDGKPLYKRDKRNKHISLGKIEYQYGKSGTPKFGCRVKTNMTLYWKNAAGKLIKTKPLRSGCTATSCASPRSTGPSPASLNSACG